jgi:hypothetical protein
MSYSNKLSIIGTFQTFYFVTTSSAFLFHQFLHREIVVPVRSNIDYNLFPELMTSLILIFQ